MLTRALSALRRAATTGRDCIVCRRREAKRGSPLGLCGKCRSSYWHHRADLSPEAAIEWAAERARQCDRQQPRERQRITNRREPAEPLRVENDCEPMSETLARVHCLACNADCGWAGVNREPSLSGECADYEPQETTPAVEPEATGAGWRR